MTKTPNIENKTVTDFFTACKVHLKSNPHGRCAVTHALVQALATQREAGAREERKKIKSLLRGKESSPKTDFDSKEEYQLHCQKIGAINWYSNLIKGQIDLPDLPETSY